jgi:hypothetical protein
MVRSPICPPARVAGQRVRMVRADRRRDGSGDCGIAAAPGSGVGWSDVLRAGSEWLVRPLDSLVSGPRRDRRRSARAGHAADGWDAHASHPLPRPERSRGRRPADCGSLWGEHSWRGHRLSADGFRARSDCGPAGGTDSCGRDQLLRRPGGARRRDPRSQCRRAAPRRRLPTQSTQGSVFRPRRSRHTEPARPAHGGRRTRARRFRGDGNGDFVVPPFHHSPRGVPGGLRSSPGDPPGCDRRRVPDRRMDNTTVPAAGPLVDGRAGTLRRDGAPRAGRR